MQDFRSVFFKLQSEVSFKNAVVNSLHCFLSFLLTIFSLLLKNHGNL
jgi:hypothetical protein